MSYIAPDSKIILCKNVPLDNTYQHTIWFVSQLAQTNYFLSKAKYTLTAQSYQRVVRGKMRVQLGADSIYDCNYLGFQNHAFGNKWFYAFITGIEYINNVVSEITFEIDSFQTYFYDSTTELKPCFVEREHSQTDAIGDNLVPENIGAPNLCVMDTHSYYWKDEDWNVMIQVKPTALYQIASGEPLVEYGEGQIAGICFKTRANNTSGLDQWLKQHTVDYEVINAYMYPAVFDSLVTPVTIVDLNDWDIKRPTAYYDYTSQTALPREYVPKNNKLFTSPYTNLLVQSSSGEQATYKWENTKEGYVKFYLYTNRLNNAECDLRPMNYYRNASQRLDSVPINEFPKVALTQMNALKPSAFVGLANDLIASGTRIAAGDPTGIGKGVESVLNFVADTGTNKVATIGDNVNLKYEQFGYLFYRMGINAQDAEVIDNYFSMYGYATRKIKVPNLNARQHWTYTKTKGCVIKCNAPADDVKKICQIFDNGITFWNDPANVGNYGDLTNGVRQG
jgi:hypothetical protein